MPRPPIANTVVRKTPTVTDTTVDFVYMVEVANPNDPKVGRGQLWAPIGGGCPVFTDSLDVDHPLCASTIGIENEGVTLPGGPFTTLDFVGAKSTAANVSATEASVTFTGGSLEEVLTVSDDAGGLNIENLGEMNFYITGPKGIQIGTDVTGASASANTGIAIGPNSTSVGNNGIAIGTIASITATGTNAENLTIGNGAIISGTNTASSTIIGRGATTNSTQTVVLGADASSTAALNVVAGNTASATGVNSVVLGYGASSTAADTVVAGYNASGTAAGSITLGANAVSASVNGISIGVYSECGVGLTLPVAIGWNSVCTGNNAINIGNNATAGSLGIALGYNAVATPSSSIAVGSGATATGNFGIAIGKGATAPLSSIVFGLDASGTDYSVVFGNRASTSTSDNAIIFGNDATITATGDNNIAIGIGSSVTGTSVADGIAIGSGATCSHSNSVVIGRGASSTAANELTLGTSTTYLKTEFSVVGGFKFLDTYLNVNVAGTDYKIDLTI